MAIDAARFGRVYMDAVDKLEGDPMFAASFWRERAAEYVDGLSAPNLAGVFDYFQREKGAYPVAYYAALAVARQVSAVRTVRRANRLYFDHESFFQRGSLQVDGDLDAGEDGRCFVTGDAVVKAATSIQGDGAMMIVMGHLRTRHLAARSLVIVDEDLTVPQGVILAQGSSQPLLVRGRIRCGTLIIDGKTVVAVGGIEASRTLDTSREEDRKELLEMYGDDVVVGRDPIVAHALTARVRAG